MTAQPIELENDPREECGVFGVWAPGEEVAKLTYYGLYALQHRGQEAAGIAVADGSQIVVFKDLGLVSQVFDEQTLAAMRGHVAVGHCRYSTTGSVTWENAQPVFRTTAAGTGVALGHNGNLVNTAELTERARDAGLINSKTPGMATTDSDIMGALLAHGAADATLEQAAMALLPTVRGAFCLVFADENTLYAARDPHGVRPLCLGRLDTGWVVASETAALDIVGASFVRDIEPGELLAIDADGVRSSRFANATPKTCVFEYVYLARPDSMLDGRSVHSTRVEIGRRLAAEHSVDADLVIGVPESGTPAAVGYAQGSGIPYGQGLMKNAYVGRTFIQPSQTIRQLGIRLKLNPLREVIRGKRLVVVDDSIVRGNTQRALVRMLREAEPPRCTCASHHRRCAGHASTASTSLPRPNLSPMRSNPMTRCSTLSAPRSVQTAWATFPPRVWSRPLRNRGRGCAAHASTVIIRSNCPRRPRSARTWSSTCLRPLPGRHRARARNPSRRANVLARAAAGTPRRRSRLAARERRS
ncbi:amidophosphoribosyltransferase [Mycobacteroides abscessus subsp. bolletii 1513]|uniref:Amidophosphoribosyltransferase n=1 Tax=Mycobacteroides abscessus subsp. bolletii 1513 TaxID=1299321 RepID=X8E076_9MYCO|nr:amidophosphoribosyltransferase [Mycobacteroides abscessus subsp. bolletii 1513]